MESSVLSKAQFSTKTTDPSGDPKFNRVRFSVKPTISKTMHIAGGHVPKPPTTHPHHRKIAKRPHRETKKV
jgi:hypothetical protein